jgi:hypothetical protein
MSSHTKSCIRLYNNHPGAAAALAMMKTPRGTLEHPLKRLETLELGKRKKLYFDANFKAWYVQV